MKHYFGSSSINECKKNIENAEKWLNRFDYDENFRATINIENRITFIEKQLKNSNEVTRIIQETADLQENAKVI